jgi:hypothetical protein
LITDCGAEVARRKEAEGWFDVSTLKEPYRVEGKKTLGYELAEQSSWTLPDVIIYPTGGGTGLVGMWKAFDEMQELGWIDSKRPRMISVQAAGCAPIVRAGHLAFDDVGARCVARHEEIRFDPCARAISRKSARRVPGRWRCQFLQPQLPRHRYRCRHSARLEALGRVERFVFYEELRHTERGTEIPGVMQRRPAFAERDDVVFATDGHHFAIAPHVGATGVESLPRQKACDSLQIIPDQ